MHHRPTVKADDELVVLVDQQGRPIGQQLKSDVHTHDTPLHLAFSLYLFDAGGRLLLTRRALTKVTWPGVWTNTCCGHPMPGEPAAHAVRRRLRAELGLGVRNLRCALPDFSYRAQDASGIQENELCPVFVGTAVHPKARFRPNPVEVVDWVWADWNQTVTAIQATPFAFSPWAVQQVEQLLGSACPQPLDRPQPLDQPTGRPA